MTDDLPPGMSPAVFDDELTRLYDREAERLVRYLVSVDRSVGWQDAEDLAQDAFMVARSRWAQVRCYRSPAAFVFATADLLRRNHGRALSRRRTDPLTDRESLAPAAASDVEMAMVLWDCLARLSERQREVLLLRQLFQFSVRETAEVLRISVGTVKSTSSEALARLRSMLNGHGELGGE